MKFENLKNRLVKTKNASKSVQLLKGLSFILKMIVQVILWLLSNDKDVVVVAVVVVAWFCLKLCEKDLVIAFQTFCKFDSFLTTTV